MTTTLLSGALWGYLAQVAPGMALTGLLWVVGAALFTLALLREGACYYAASTAASSSSTDASAAASAAADEREGRVA